MLAHNQQITEFGLREGFRIRAPGQPGHAGLLSDRTHSCCSWVLALWRARGSCVPASRLATAHKARAPSPLQFSLQCAAARVSWIPILGASHKYSCRCARSALYPKDLGPSDLSSWGVVKCSGKLDQISASGHPGLHAWDRAAKCCCGAKGTLFEWDTWLGDARAPAPQCQLRPNARSVTLAYSQCPCVCGVPLRWRRARRRSCTGNAPQSVDTFRKVCTRHQSSGVALHYSAKLLLLWVPYAAS